MLLLSIIIIALIAMLVFVFAGLIQQQHEDYRIYGKKGETYKDFCNRYYTRWF